MSTVKTNAAQIGQSVTATNNFTMYQPSSPDGTVRWGVGNSGSVTDIVTLNSSGNVGIGTSSPTEKMTVAGAVIATGAAASLARDAAIIDFSTATSRFIASRSGGNYGQWEAHVAGASGITKRHQIDYDSTFHWYGADGTTERMRIDSSGNLLVGMTGAAGNSAKLEVTNDNWGSYFYTTAASGSGLSVGLRRDNAGVVAGFLYNGALYSSAVGNISITSSATAYNTSSDYRLKENIQPMQNALAVVQQLNPVTYTWKADGSDGQGFIAHELQAVVPDCVTGEKDAVDAEGNPVYQGIDTSFLVATLTKAIQELTARIEQLEAK